MKRVHASVATFFFLLGGILPAVSSETAVRDLKFFLQRLEAVDHLPEMENSHTAMSSTWDRTGGNKDGTDFKRIEDGRNILLDVDGPGCIHRIFTGRVGINLVGTRIRFYFDNSASPTLDLEVNEFFDPKNGPLPYPLVFHKTYPGTLFPIPFASHCRIELYRPGTSDPSVKQWGNYWQITYTRYPTNISVKTLEWPLSEMNRAVLKKTCRKLLDAELHPPDSTAQWAIRKKIVLARGKTTVEAVKGSGVIRQLRLFANPQTPEVLKQVIMRLRWDGNEKPSVDMPIGYFFGNTETGYSAEYNSLLIGVTKDYAYCNFPMPFEEGAAIRFENRSQRDVRLKLWVDIQKHNQLPTDLGRFHATVAETEVEPGWANIGTIPRFGPKKVTVHSVLDVANRKGKYVGVFLHVDWPLATWWGEGDWLIWTDQDGWPPDYHGTGTEEYFNCGWGKFDRKAISGIIKEPEMRPGHVGVYSFHLNDSFSFESNLRVAVEIWPLEPPRPQLPHAFWRSTAYWYEYLSP